MVIVAAVDGREGSDRVVRTGDDLASAYGAELVVVHVMATDVYEERREAGDPDGYTIDEHAEPDARTTAREVVADALDGDERVTVVGRVGDPATEILAEADRRDARYLVVGGRRRSPVGKAVFGSVTQSVLLESDRPVVTVMSRAGGEG